MARNGVFRESSSFLFCFFYLFQFPALIGLEFGPDSRVLKYSMNTANEVADPLL